MMGTFYRSPSPGAPPFIKAGDIVTARSIIGIIEVMKVMSSVEAGLAGRVSSILVEDGQLVQYNQPLLLIDCEEQSAEAAHE
jgi:acetyl-CoA carboxylase biotin carboxyl carrier protein